MKKIIIGLVSLLVIIGTIFAVIYIKNKEVKTEEDIIFGDNEKFDYKEFEKYEDLIYSLVGNYFSYNTIKITELEVNQKINLEDLTDEQIFYASYRAAYVFDKVKVNDTEESEENCYANGYSSSLEYIINIDDIKSYAKKIYNKNELTYFPDDFYDNFQYYKRNNNTYVGRSMLGEDVTGYEYNITNITANKNKITIILFASNRTNEVSINCESEDCEEPVVINPYEYKIIFNLKNENYEFVSLERTK